MQSIQHFTQTQFWQVRDYLAPVLKESKFKEHGRITPEEFVAAGDFLCYKFPTWSWEAGDANKRRDFLPPTKQYLISRKVPCLRRASQMVYTDADEDAETMMSFAAEGAVKDDDDEWAVTHTTRAPQSGPGELADIPDLDAQPALGRSADPGNLAAATGRLSLGEGGEEKIPDMDDIPDMEDEDLAEGAKGVVEEEDAAAVPATTNVGAGQIGVGQTNPGNLVSVRTYDCLITYDKYYQTPRMWLLGFDEHGSPLPPAQTFLDVSPDYAQKTVTIEPFPHLAGGVAFASVHPCKHASVMKKVIERMDGTVKAAQAGGAGASGGGTVKEKEKKKWGFGGVVKKATGGSKKDDAKKADAAASTETDSPPEDQAEGLRVDQYLLVFLKFISSVVPTIEIDSTTSV